MSSRAFDGIRVLTIGAVTVPVEILPADRTTVTTEGGAVDICRSGDTLYVSQGGGVTAKSAFDRAGRAFANASVITRDSSHVTSATVHCETASANAESNSNAVGDDKGTEAPEKITIYVPQGTAIEVKNYVNGTFRMGAIKGPLAIDQMVNARIVVDEVTAVNINMLVNCHGHIHATDKVRRGMMVNCDVRID